MNEKNYKTNNCPKTICWDCRKATGGCSWSRELKPVEGWKAEPTKIKAVRHSKSKMHSSYIVYECPLFVEG